ncbi:MAG: VCBS repeat-containing protein [Pirellulaceae bacterium]
MVDRIPGKQFLAARTWAWAGAVVIAMQLACSYRGETMDSGEKETPSANVDSGSPAVSDVTPVSLPDVEGGTKSPANSVTELSRKVDVDRDDWRSEQLASRAMDQLSKLQGALQGPTFDEQGVVDQVVAGGGKCAALCPEGLTLTCRDSAITVRRMPTETEAKQPVRGASEPIGLQFRRLYEALGAPGERHAKFKLFRIEPLPEQRFATRVRYEASCNSSKFRRQQTAVWQVIWNENDASAIGPLIESIRVLDYEECESQVTGSVIFREATVAALGANVNFTRQIMTGIRQWQFQLTREFMGQFGHNGLAVGDVNNDGLEDLYVCDSGGLPNRLYIHQADGTARDESAERGVDFLDDSTGILIVDLDNDGDQDLVIAADPAIQFAENDGRGYFQLRTSMTALTDSMSLSAVDYDRDGYLDIYVCGYNVRKQDPASRGLPFPFPYHDANNGGRNILLRNDGHWQFSDVTDLVGLGENNSRFSMAAAWEDFDNDGDQDLYVANDFGRDNLYENDGGRFRDLASQLGVDDHGAGMSVSWADYNRDGVMDIYVGNMFSAAGNRVTYQARFETMQKDGGVASLRHMARGNTLFAGVTQQGRQSFRDVTEVAAVEMGRWAWSSVFTDFNNDGWADIMVANGFVTNEYKDDL